MKWVTREHPKVDHVSCPWLVQRFILEAVLDGRRVMHFADESGAARSIDPRARRALRVLQAEDGELAGTSAAEDGGGWHGGDGRVRAVDRPRRRRTIPTAAQRTGRRGRDRDPGTGPAAAHARGLTWLSGDHLSRRRSTSSASR